MLPLTVVFVRHGELAQQSINEQLGPPLTPLGKRQAERVAKRLANQKFDHIYSSNLARAYKTAQAILKFHETTPFTVTPDIREVTGYHFMPGPTPRKKAVLNQVRMERSALENFANHLLGRHKPGEKILIICHGNVIRSLTAILGGRNPKKSVLIGVNNTSVTILDIWPNGEPVLKLANCVKHLQPRQVT